MKTDIYIKISPDFPTKNDFKNFSVWCEWNEAEEVPYLKSLCDSDSEYQKVIIAPYEKGLETYYPIISQAILPKRVYLFVLVNVQIASSELSGYASIVEDEVVSITIWKNLIQENEITFLSCSRLLAEGENPKAIKELATQLEIEAFSTISFSSDSILSNNKKVSGILQLS